MTALGGRKQLNLEECIADFMKAEKMTGPASFPMSIGVEREQPFEHMVL